MTLQEFPELRIRHGLSGQSFDCGRRHVDTALIPDERIAILTKLN